MVTADFEPAAATMACGGDVSNSKMQLAYKGKE
jgi:hypothetical protein